MRFFTEICTFRGIDVAHQLTYFVGVFEHGIFLEVLEQRFGLEYQLLGLVLGYAVFVEPVGGQQQKFVPVAHYVVMLVPV